MRLYGTKDDLLTGVRSVETTMSKSIKAYSPQMRMRFHLFIIPTLTLDMSLNSVSYPRRLRHKSILVIPDTKLTFRGSSYIAHIYEAFLSKSFMQIAINYSH